jgi:transglutaminase-like putative cysteine protease
MKRLSLLLALSLSACTSSGAPPEKERERAARPAPERVFQIRYVAHLDDLPQGKSLRLWIPIPSDDPHQEIGELQVEAPWPHRITRDPAHGNRTLYFEGQGSGDATITVRYAVRRWAYTTDLSRPPATVPAPGAHDLEPSRLVVVNERIRETADHLAGKTEGRLALARSFYDYVRAEMAYDKSGEGWGRGDSSFACEVGRGNCTDYHAYFMALCLAAKIPSRFQIGLYGTYEAHPGAEAKTGGYHCWSEFHLPGHGWVPVDVSEADKNPQRAEEFFGGHTSNRVTLSTGRDLVLEPPQAGDPLNYLLTPYCEVEGQTFPTRKTSFWRDKE